ncbi:hypothetical protein P170DRAFT_507148 [Aspergillus steynii IBT 23096]|uniref:Tyrosine specific protein phosphatases domain-containing protein n=1 Tax=Aspergillus steynii IBT 23096 TaxID=1392250 RepID=A0A2I2GHI5_9EURO|nr:uncharacterized protein P170DRAFT_507148 [Aspergillus steynii IBT 23096]PLB52334.1 hypothetical protein P170DRAFT_507148 [Aspergillus steynii IBT 23096]
MTLLLDKYYGTGSFPTIEGLDNFRDAGGFLTSSKRRVRKGMIFRSANPMSVNESDFSKLDEAYGIKAIFDLRHSTFDESTRRIRMAGPIPVHIVPAVKAFEDGFLHRYFDLLMTNHVDALSDLYMCILGSATDGFRFIFDFIRDNPNTPFLINCELGKDRTGVFIAVILLVLRVSDEDIIEDFGLSEKGIGHLIPSRKEKLRNVLSSNNVSAHPVALDRHFATVRDAMRVFLFRFRAIYGSGEIFLQSIGFTEDDISTVRENLMLPT